MKSQAKLFYVEDNPDDILLLQIAIRKGNVPVTLETFQDGQKAMSALEERATEDLPTCVLLDLKLPGWSGFDVLAWIRSQPRLKCVPVLVFTCSQLKRDIDTAYDLGA